MTPISTTIGDGPGFAPAEERASPLVIVALAMVIGVAYFLIDHRWDAVQYHGDFDEYSSMVNDTADRVETGGKESAAARLLLALIGGVWLLKPARQSLQVDGLLTLALGSCLLYMTASYLWSASPSLTMHKLLVVYLFVLAAIGMSKQLRLEDLVLMVALTSLGLIAIGLVAELKFGTFRPWRSEFRFIGTCHPNTLSAYGAIVCLSAGVVASRLPAGRFRWDWLLIAIGITTILLTKSRTSLAAVIVGLMAARYARATGSGKAMLATLALFVAGGAILYTGLSSSRGWSSAGDVASLGRTEDVGSLTGRVPLWEELLDQVEKRPIFGYGYLAFWDKANVERLSDLFQWEIPHAHNLFLDLTLDGGVVGLGLFLVTVLIALWSTSNHFGTSEKRGAYFVFGMLAFLLVHGAAESLFKLPNFLAFTIVVCLLRVALAGRPSAVPEASAVANSTALERSDDMRRLGACELGGSGA